MAGVKNVGFVAWGVGGWVELVEDHSLLQAAGLDVAAAQIR